MEVNQLLQKTDSFHPPSHLTQSWREKFNMKRDVRGFATCTNNSNAVEVKLNLWTRSEQYFVSIPISKVKDLGNVLVVNFRPEDEKILVQNHVETISLSVLMSLAYNIPLGAKDMSRILLKDYHVFIDNLYDEKFMNLIVFQPIARKFSTLLTNCFNILEQKHLYQVLELEIQLVPVFWMMSSKGYYLDMNRMYLAKRSFEERFDDLSTNFYRYYGVHFLNYFGADAQALKMQQECKRFFRRIRTLAKIENSQLQTHFNSCGTRTFRITTSNSNVQGLPKEIRQCLLPRIGDELVEFDLTSSQVIILACLADEDNLITRYEEGEDLYKYFASLMFNISIHTVTDEQRDVVKITFLQYINGAGGMQLQKEFQTLEPNITVQDSRILMEGLIDSFPRLKSYLKKTRNSTSYILKSGRVVVSENANCLLAYILQGIEAEVLKQTLIEIYARFQKIRDAELYMCIHDAIIIDLKGYCLGTVRIMVKECFLKSIRRYFPQLKKIQIKESRYE